MTQETSMPDLVRALAAAGHAASSADNSQPWHMAWDGESLSLAYDRPRVAGTTFAADSPATLMTMGAVIENMAQALEAAPLTAQWEFPPPRDAEETTYARVKLGLRAGEHSLSESLTLQRRYTNRMPFRKEPVTGELLDSCARATEGAARSLAVRDAEQVRAVAGLVRRASEVRFQTAELVDWLGRSFRFGRQAEGGDGLDVATLHLPPGGSLFLRFIREWWRMRLLNRVGAYKVMAVIDAQPVSRAPALVAIAGPPGWRETLDAGRLMERVWIDLNARGLAVHPYYVVTDQLYRLAEGTVPERLRPQVEAIAAEVPAVFGLRKGETIQMLFRVGYPKHEPVRSRRLPLDSVYADLTAR